VLRDVARNSRMVDCRFDGTFLCSFAPSHVGIARITTQGFPRAIALAYTPVTNSRL